MLREQILATVHQVKHQTYPLSPKKVKSAWVTEQEMANYDLVKHPGNVPRALAVHTPNDGILGDGMTLYIYLHDM
jgi:hypothetical protein